VKLMPTKVLLDTDIDIVGDIDDAMCLAYLLAQPGCDLLGITTVSWETDKRAMVASALCKAAGRRVPIFPGAAAPLLVPLPSVESQQPYDVERAILERFDHDETFPRGQAVEFMRQTIRAHPGEVVLLAIGPLTNIGLLFAADPEIPQLLKGLVMMAGVFADRQPGADLREWNARLDPHASAIVYRAAVSMHRSIGLDVTRHVRMDAAELRRRLGGRPPQPLGGMIAAWLATAPSVTFHDPLAAATIFEDRICRFEQGLVEVELASERLQGLTHWTPGGPATGHEVALAVNRDVFFEHYFSTLLGLVKESIPHSPED
jgi:inosine-uridine nucleoside N-ribohydrolase